MSRSPAGRARPAKPFGPSLVLSALAAFAAAESWAAEGRTITIGESFDGGMVSVAPGDELAVRLPASSGASHAWSIAFVDSSILKPLGQPAMESSPSGASGPPGSQTLRFEAVGSGSTGIGLAYRRSAEPSAVPERLFRVQATVRADAGRRTLALAEPDDGSRIYVVEGDALLVRLPSNVTTGYSWTVSQNNPAVLAPSGQPRYEAPSRPAPGAGGAQVFEFRVAGPGSAWLQLSYRRPFEKDAPAVRSWNLFVAAAAD